MKPVITFGEIMIRVDMPGHRRIRQAMPGSVEMSFAGAEANVAVSIANFGGSARFVTALPDHAITDSCISVLNGLNVDTRFVIKTREGRLGLYYVETGANQRPSTVVYDRAGSSVSLVGGDRYAWPEIFDGASWFHVTGITPALSQQAADAVCLATAQAEQAGLTVSCDLNYRGRLWSWKPGISPSDLAGETMRRILPDVDVVISNEEDAAMVLGIRAKDTNVEAGKLSVDHYPEVAREIVRQFPKVRRVAITLRESISATHNRWGGCSTMPQPTPPTSLRCMKDATAPTKSCPSWTGSEEGMRSRAHSSSPSARPNLQSRPKRFHLRRPLLVWPTRFRGTSTIRPGERWRL